MLGIGWTFYNEVIRHDSVRTIIRYSRHRAEISKRMILLSNREYSQGFLDELNFICHGFLDPAIDFLLDAEDDDSLIEDLEPYFPSYLLYEDAGHCYEIFKELYEWLEDDFYHPVTRLHEYVLMKAIQDQWAFFDDLPEEESKDLRNTFYSLSGENFLTEEEVKAIAAMKGDELITLRAIIGDMDFGEMELIASFRQKASFAFLRF